MGIKPRIETIFERGLFMSRWLMAPFYLGLVLALFMLLVVFTRQLVGYVPVVFGAAGMSDNDAILALLTLIDLSLTGNLLLIVLFSGYENFVSKLDLDGETDRPPWMGTVDFSGLKMKLIASIVAISGIQLLKTFMNIGKPGYEFDQAEAMWGVIIHLTFVASGVLLALMDWLTAKTDKH
ncbi:TIGR00645 family protein [Brevundimonas sp.]|jgi:uncharacterized protein (TIGR00645 family)|uniref:TIGR00645 family protein n=1 Tax=Brevundimonas sp. TaxID=1871086 RepID=UPI002E141967|nr:TIGR00645 family protein [Brevundimonas sp.]